MTIDKLPAHSFLYPHKIHRIVFCDFDETYYPSFHKNRIDSGINKLEDFINRKCDELSFIIGWVTGSNINSIIKKSKNYITHYPHFIACSLGTELYWIQNNRLITSEEWDRRISESNFNKVNIDHTVKVLLQEKNIHLTRQADDYQGKYLGSYYYHITEDELTDIETINDYAAKCNLKVSVSKCNTATGDPKDSYDINFIPLCCGKKEIVLFLSNLMRVDIENTWAFGDSFNDIEMLETANNSFLVANADIYAKQHFGRVLCNKYCVGIMEGLEKI